jgi:tetratricopeptide (TPR) repeat protein
MNMLKKSLMIIGLVVLSLGMFAQSVEEAGAKYNEGNEQMKAKNYSGAVTSFEAALKLIKGTGGEGEDLKGNIESQLMNAYYRNGISKYKAKKYDASVSEFEKSYSLAEKNNDADMQDKLTVIMAKVLSSKGLTQLKSDELDAAYATFEQALQVKPTCVISYYGKGLVWKERGQLTSMMESMDKAIELAGTEPKMSKYADKAKSAASKALLAEATEEITKEHGKEAAKHINDSFKYEPGNADAYYYLTIAYNKSKEFDKAAEAANKALGMKEGDKSGIYFELGQALKGSGDTSGACDAFKKVTSGPNVDAAKYEITQTLKCG